MCLRRCRFFLLALSLAVLCGCAVKPSPFSPAEQLARATQDRSILYANQSPLSGPLTLEEAVARALLYNLDHRLAVMESIFHEQQLTAANFSMLPKLAANAGYSHRDNDSASSSISYETRNQSLEPSISSERDRKTADLTLTWTVLDFGLSYFQAKQQADRLLIIQERKRRVANNIVKEVIGAYWRAVTADKIEPLLTKALADAQSALVSYDRIHKERLAPPLELLEQHRDLLTIISQLRRIQADMAMARVRLATLVSIPLHEHFEIATPEKHLLTPPKLSASLEELENTGLILRPDLREEMYQERIDKTEVHKEILRMVPGVSIFAGLNYDANKFLVHNSWTEIGARTTMNLFNLLSAPAQVEAANTRVEVTKARRLALTVAALVQINLSYHQYQQALEDYNHSRDINSIESEICAIVQREQAAEAQNRLALIRHSISAMRAQMEEDRALSDTYYFWGNMYFSLGGDIIASDVKHNDLVSAVRSVKESMNLWWSGTLPSTPDARDTSAVEEGDSSEGQK